MYKVVPPPNEVKHSKSQLLVQKKNWNMKLVALNVQQVHLVMQKFSSSHLTRRGFSLVEVLVVIAIIAVLAAVSYPIANKMIKKSKVEKNRAIITTLERAIDQFYDEYGYYPIEPLSNELSDGDIIAMLNELHGSGDNLTYNTKGKNYIGSMPDASSKRGGLVWGGDQIDEFRHTFTPVDGRDSDFFILLDSDYDKTITVTDSDYQSKDIKGKRALIWSKGEDLVEDASSAKEEAQALLDDVKNWE